MESKINSINKSQYFFIVVVFLLSFYGSRWWFKGIFPATLILGIFLSLASFPSLIKTKHFKWFLLYSIIVFLDYYSGDDYFSNFSIIREGFIAITISFALTSYVLSKKDYNLMKWIIKASLFVMLWTAVVSFILDISFPGIVRHFGGAMINDNPNNIDIDVSLYKLGLSDYLSPHAIPILFPPLIMGIKHEKRKYKQLVLLSCLLAGLLLLYLSSATGPMIVGMMIVLLAFVVKEGSFNNNIGRMIVILLIFLPLIYSPTLQNIILGWFDDLLGNKGFFHEKIVEFQSSLIYGDFGGDLSLRQDLYTETLVAIGQNPILGTNGIHGGHSALLDRFASVGLVGFIPLVCMLVFQAKYILKHLADRSRIYYYIGFLAAIIMMSIKNVTCWHMWFYLFALLPFCVKLFSNDSIRYKSRL